MDRAKDHYCLRRPLIISEKVKNESNQRSCTMDAQVGPVMFPSSSNVFAQRNVAKYHDKQNNLKSKFLAACAGKLDSNPLFDLL